MDEIDIRERLLQVMNSNGYTVDKENPTEELMFDSLQFISTIVEIENEFEISVSDEYLTAEELNNFNEYFNMVLSTLSLKKI